MTILHCTQKMLNSLKIDKKHILENEELSTTMFGNWYANLIRVNHFKGYLFVHEITLYSFVVFRIQVTLGNISSIFQEALSTYLKSEGFGDSMVKSLLLETVPLSIAKTASKYVLGCMNDIARQYDFNIMKFGGPQTCDWTKAIKEVNRVPQLTLKFVLPIEAFQAFLSVSPMTNKQNVMLH